jgi:hypothetical protein
LDKELRKVTKHAAAVRQKIDAALQRDPEADIDLSNVLNVSADQAMRSALWCALALYRGAMFCHSWKPQCQRQAAQLREQVAALKQGKFIEFVGADRHIYEDIT